MDRKKYYLIIIVLLILTNIASIYYTFFQKSPPPKQEGPRNLIIERLHFTEQQIIDYDELIQWHQKNIREKDSILLSLKSELYKSLNSPTNNTDSIISHINLVQKDIEHIHIKHFKEIEKLCTKEQKKYFNELTGELAKLFGRKPKWTQDMRQRTRDMRRGTKDNS